MNKHFFDIAKNESYKATYSGYSGVKIGCVVVYHGTVLAKGSNSNKSHTTQSKMNIYRYNDKHLNHYYHASIHAEIQALNKIQMIFQVLQGDILHMNKKWDKRRKRIMEIIEVGSDLDMA